MTAILLRRAAQADAARLNQALARLSAHLGDTHRASDDMIAQAGWGPHPAFRALLAERDRAVLGAALYAPCFSTARGGAVLYVSDLWVDPAARGCGLGRRLLSAVLADARADWSVQALRLTVYDTTPRALAFYRKLGFAPASGQTDLTLDAAGCAALERPT